MDFSQNKKCLDKIVGKIKTHFIFSNFFLIRNRAINDVMGKNTVEPDGQQIAIWHMCMGCCIPQVTETHSEHIILIALPLQN
jgi:hypothetical protein